MRPSKIETGEALKAIRDVFRTQGYDGASLTLLAKATGLQRASLYHRFPDGKDGMALAVLDQAEAFLEQEHFSMLKSDRPWRERLETMCRQLDAYYDGGRTLCLLAAFSLGSVPDSVRAKARAMTQSWRACLVVLAQDAGRTREDAESVAEEMLVAIQGGLILAALMDDIAPFQRALARFPALLTGTVTI